MDVHKLDKIFKPERIALFGATENPEGLGRLVLRNLIGSGFQGVVYPVHPTLEAMQAVTCYPDARSLPRNPDMAIVCSKPRDVPEVVRACGKAGILGLVIMSAGFSETGDEGRKLEEEIRSSVRRFEGMRIIGPNCLGVVLPGIKLNASFAARMPHPGHVAFISQSGALCTAVLDWALEQNIGFSSFVSIGNMTDVNFGDLIDYFGEDENTKSILLYVESVKDARKFMSAARAFARTKPIVVYKAGRFAESAKAAASHTGAMAGEDAVYDAAFQRAGLARVFEIREIFDVAELIARYTRPKGPRLGIVTNAGGPAVMAIDALTAEGGILAQLSQETMKRLDEALPPAWSHANPVDVLGDARPHRYAKAAELVLDDPGVDAALFILTPQVMTDPTATAEAICKFAPGSSKPVLTAFLGGQSVREGGRIFNRCGIATYSAPEQAVKAFMTLVSYARNLESLFELPREVNVNFRGGRGKPREKFGELAEKQEKNWSEIESKQLLKAYGIRVAEAQRARSADAAVKVARRIGYPVALKILSSAITHKTDVHGVALDLKNDAAVRNAFKSIESSARKEAPEARMEGVSVQPMIRMKEGRELILGAKMDPTFGPVIMIGLGGTAAEVLRDRALGLPPLNERLVLRMLESLESWPLLQGYRGQAGVNIDVLVETLLRFSHLVADCPEIQEIDVNPLLATPEEAIALDARVIIDQEALGKKVEPYSHMVLRPYPDEFERRVKLEDGTPVTLRPIKPEDEPRWKNLLASCSEESIYARFHGFFHWDSHETAVRYCYIDYDREMAIVAEIKEKGEPKLIGVGRLVGDPDVETAEYAILLADAWQGKGLGGLLTDYCEELSRGRGVKRIIAHTLPENARTIRIFKRRGFHLSRGPDLVTAVKELG